jgi:hypothetical protein
MSGLQKNNSSKQHCQNFNESVLSLDHKSTAFLFKFDYYHKGRIIFSGGTNAEKSQKKSINANKEGVTMPQKKAKKPYQKTKNKPAKKKNKGPDSSKKVGAVNTFTFHQPKRVDISIFIGGGRVRPPTIQVGHKGSLRR